MLYFPLRLPTIFDCCSSFCRCWNIVCLCSSISLYFLIIVFSVPSYLYFWRYSSICSCCKSMLRAGFSACVTAGLLIRLFLWQSGFTISEQVGNCTWFCWKAPFCLIVLVGRRLIIFVKEMSTRQCQTTTTFVIKCKPAYTSTYLPAFSPSKDPVLRAYKSKQYDHRKTGT